jgi:hypothetical protein
MVVANHQTRDFSGQKSADSDIFYTGATGQNLQVQGISFSISPSMLVGDYVLLVYSKVHIYWLNWGW